MDLVSRYLQICSDAELLRKKRARWDDPKQLLPQTTGNQAAYGNGSDTAASGVLGHSFRKMEKTAVFFGAPVATIGEKMRVGREESMLT